MQRMEYLAVVDRVDGVDFILDECSNYADASFETSVLDLNWIADFQRANQGVEMNIEEYRSIGFCISFSDVNSCHQTGGYVDDFPGATL